MGEAKRRRQSGPGERSGPVLHAENPTPGTFKIANPLLVMFADQRGEVVCHIHPSEHCPTHETYGLLIADLVRHVARAFKVGEDDLGMGRQGTRPSHNPDHEPISR